jgi:hypothetical protein
VSENECIGWENECSVSEVVRSTPEFERIAYEGSSLRAGLTLPFVVRPLELGPKRLQASF